MDQRSCVQVIWNGYSSYFMCFMKWTGSKGCFWTCEPEGSGHRCCGSVSAVCLSMQHLHGKGRSECRLRQLAFQLGCWFSHSPALLCFSIFHFLESFPRSLVLLLAHSPWCHSDLTEDFSLTTRKSAMKGNSFFSLTKSICTQTLYGSLHCLSQWQLDLSMTTSIWLNALLWYRAFIKIFKTLIACLAKKHPHSQRCFSMFLFVFYSLNLYVAVISREQNG